MIERIKHTKYNSTRINTGMLREPNLSLKAKGLMAYLLAEYDDLVPTIKEIAAGQKDGEKSVLSAWRELEQAGYIVEKGKGDHDPFRHSTATIKESTAYKTEAKK